MRIFVEPDVTRCLVIGDSVVAEMFKKRLEYQYQQLTVEQSRDVFISGHWDCAFLVNGDLQKITEQHKDNIGVIVSLSEPDLIGFCGSQKELNDSDWQALRDVERQLLAMDKAGIWTLPDSVRSRMNNREQLRTSVDKEIG